MKKTLFLGLAMALATCGVFARESRITPSPQGNYKPQGTVEERAKKQTDMINTTAQLSPDQYKKVLDIKKNIVGQRDAARASGAQGDDLKAKFKAIGQDEDNQLKAVLTPEQFAKYQASKHQHNMGAPRGQ